MKLKSLLSILMVFSILLFAAPTSLAEGTNAIKGTDETTMLQPEKFVSSAIDPVDSTNEVEENCIHHVWYYFDEEAMTISGVYDDETVESFTELFQEMHRAVIYSNDEEVTTGYLEEGMVVQIYHDDELYGEYRIDKLEESCPNTLQQTQNGMTTMAATSSAGFTLPIDNIILSPQMAGNISQYFNTAGHKGIDFASGGHYTKADFEQKNVPVRAVRGGTVIYAGFHTNSNGTLGYGNLVVIAHGSVDGTNTNVSTWYAHMKYTPLVSSGQTVTQGQILGYVGSTGNSEGPHLHFEVRARIGQSDNMWAYTVTNPLAYLQGAGTYTTSPNGWQQINGCWYYYINGIKVTGWQNIGGSRYYFNSVGQMCIGWYNIGGSVYFFNAQGQMCIGWYNIEGSVYFFNAQGQRCVGWYNIEGSVYFFNTQGKRVTGLQSIDGYKYYFDSTGKRQTGWQTINGYRHYFATDGKMHIGWYRIGDYVYFFNPNGQALTGWQMIDDSYYNFSDTGQRHQGLYNIDGLVYYFASNGKMQTGWQIINSNTYYFYPSESNNRNGHRASGEIIIDGQVYIFGSNGILLT